MAWRLHIFLIMNTTAKALTSNAAINPLLAPCGMPTPELTERGSEWQTQIDEYAGAYADTHVSIESYAATVIRECKVILAGRAL